MRSSSLEGGGWEVSFIGFMEAKEPRVMTCGHVFIAARTTRIVTMPPPTTEITGPNHAAVMPDSNAPSSFEVQMKTLFTAETRPRMVSGVRSWTRVWRTITLMVSTAPVRARAAMESGKDFERPKTMVPMPNHATEKSMERPARFMGGR